MPDPWTVADSVSLPSERQIAKSIRRAAESLPASPTAASWKRYQASLAAEIEEAMVKSAEKAVAAAGKNFGLEGALTAQTRKQIAKLAREQARLITSNSRRAVTESLRKLKRLGLTQAETKQIVTSIAGLNRQQAGAVVNRLRMAIENGKRFSVEAKKARSRANRYLRFRAKSIGQWQGRRVANVGVDAVLQAAVRDQSILAAAQRWRAKSGACQWCAALNGRSVPAGETFTHPQTGKALHGSDAHLHCRCTIEALVLPQIQVSPFQQVAAVETEQEVGCSSR